MSNLLSRCALPGLALFLTSLSFAQKVNLDIYLSGNKVGVNEFSVTNGQFASNTELNLGSINVSSHVTGTVVNDRLSEYSAVSQSPQGKSDIHYDGSKVTAIANGKTVSAEYTDTGVWAGNLHPQFFSSALDRADKMFAASPSLKKVDLPALLLDAGSVLTLSISKDGSRKLGDQVASAYKVTLTGIALSVFRGKDGHIVAEDVPVQKLRFVEHGWEGLFVDPIAKYPELSQATLSAAPVIDDMVPMRDGVKLSTSVAKPTKEGRYPVILVRTPYGKGTEIVNSAFYVTRGYVFVVQDCRGREASEGNWDPFVNEGRDGYDTIAWIAKQPWCDGKVGMIGGSYAGYVQWAAAVLNPPALKCIVPQVSPPDAMHNIPYDNGVFMLYTNLWWARIVAGKHSDFSGMKSALPNVFGLMTLPLSKVDDKTLGQNLKFFDQWLERDSMSKWKGYDYSQALQNVRIPALHISGIWDGDEIGTHMNWGRMRELGRGNQWIIFGPWVHAFNTNTSFGGENYGDGAIIDLDSVELRWFDTWLKGKAAKQAQQPHARIFITGANRWINTESWPSKAWREEHLYLSRGSLTKSPSGMSTLHLDYDPAHQSFDPTKANSDASTVLPKDSLKNAYTTIFRSEPMKKATSIASPFKLSFEFSSSAVNTDFFVLLCDESPDGKVRYLGLPGKVRASYLQGFDKPRALVPNRRYLANLIPWDFAHEFKAGHRLVVWLSCSMFPSASRNLGTMEPIATATKMVPQHNRVYLGTKNASLSYFVIPK